MTDVKLVQNVSPVKTELNQKKEVNFQKAPAPVTKDCSKDMLLYLTTLASTVVAGLALYKNHGAQKELKKVVEKLQASETNLKNLTNETETKIKNAVEEALKDSKQKIKSVETTKKTHYTDDDIGNFGTNSSRKKRKRTSSDFEQSTREGEMYLAEEEAAVRKAKKASDRRNQEWLDKQHNAKEKEYDEWMNKALNEKETAEGLKILEEEEAAVRKAKKASDRRNQEWLEKQHKVKEKEYDEWMNKALNEKETAEGLKILEEEEAAVRKAKKASDRRNQEWLEAQHKAKEKEYNKFYNEEYKETFDAIEEQVDIDLKRKAENALRQKEIEETFNQHPIRAGYLNTKATVRHFYNTKVATPVKEKYAQIKSFFSKKSA